jgi:hypothetical protein
VQGTDIRAFSPDGKFLWELHSLTFCNTYDVDPAGDGEDIYNTYSHIRLDLDKTKPGTEQTYHAYNWDWRRFGAPPRPHSAQAMLRRMGADNKLILFTSDQGIVGGIDIFRYEGELLVPCGSLRDSRLWIDTDGDGKKSPDEEVKVEGYGIGWITTYCVDSRGDLWIGVPTTQGSFMRRFALKGFTEHGAPIYGGTKADYEEIRFPDEGDTTDARAMLVRLDYDADRDVMILYFPTEPRNHENPRQPRRYALARFDDWSKGNRQATWKIASPTPFDPAYVHLFMNEKNFNPQVDFTGMQRAGDYIFFTYMFGDLHVYDLKTGELVEILNVGPEVAGHTAWEDAAMGLRVFQRKNGEYLIFTENGGWGGKNNFIRWKP